MKGRSKAACIFNRRATGLFAICLAGALLCLFMAAELVAETQGGLVCENPVFDFGIAGPGDEITHVFWLANNSQQPVIITRIVAPCETALDQKPEEPVAPGFSFPLGLRIKAEETPGHFARRIIIHYGGQASQELALEIKGQVKTGIVLIPGSIVLKAGDGVDEQASGSSLAVSLDADELFLHRVSTQVDWLSVSFTQEAFRGRRAYRVFVSLGPDAPEGQFMETVTLHTGSQSRPRLDIVVRGEVGR
ncbi:MAG: DUF1573 domain-containing protein [Desulfatibacillaceae bacterium]|nr:DUF1573 domain-containing protein [Desulfatibacillaceae bacterium]